ncbi:hypothetical protein Tco_0595015 [Tanacetum coccineum]
MEHFGVQLEDTTESPEEPTQAHYKGDQNLQRLYADPSSSRVKEEYGSSTDNSSDDFTGLLLTQHRIPKPEETLTLYLAAANEAISAVLLTKRRGVEKQIYFISCALQGPKINYPSLEKVALSLKARQCAEGSGAGPSTILIQTDKRSKNKRADALSKLASSSFAHLTKKVLEEIVRHRSIDVKIAGLVDGSNNT